MTPVLALTLLIAPPAPFKQTPEPSAATRRYYESRKTLTIPKYGADKVQALIKTIKTKDQDDDVPTSVLPRDQFDKLSLAEQFTYTMLHGELGLQNCDAMMYVNGAEKKVFGHFPDAFGDESTWSESQEAFMRSHRAEFVPLIRETMAEQGVVGVNIKHAVLVLKANEVIPDLVAVYKKNRKDHDILTLLMLLMRDGEYRPFLKSATYRKLYGEQSSYSSWITASKANQDLVGARAMAFHASKTK